MPGHNPRIPIVIVGILVILVLLAGIALPMLLRESAADDGRPKAVLSIEHDGFLYTYHVPTDTEGLFDLADDPRRLRNLAPGLREETLHLRTLLTRDLGIEDLEDLRVHFEDSIRTLESLGYL